MISSRGKAVLQMPITQKKTNPDGLVFRNCTSFPRFSECRIYGFAFLRKSHGRANSPPDCLLGPAFRIRPPNAHYAEKDQSERIGLFLVGEDGFEPSKRYAADLQSVPFGHSGTPPYSIICSKSLSGAGRRTRTPDLLITNQLLYQLSYTGGSNRTRLL